MNKIKFELHSKEELESLVSAIDHALLPDKRILHNLHENLKDMLE